MRVLGIREKSRISKMSLVGVIVATAIILAFATLPTVPQMSFAKKHHSDLSTSSPSTQGTTTGSGETFADGVDAGKAQGKTDALNGVNNSFCDNSIHSNFYCAGYKVGYNANHIITNIVR